MLSILLAAAIVQSPPTLSHGPIVGCLTPTHASVWVRAAGDGEVAVSVTPDGDFGAPPMVARSAAAAERDHCLIFQIDGLAPGTAYTCRFDAPDSLTARFTTPKADHAPARVTLAIGSCADEKSETVRCYERMAEAKADALVLIGDTPYIDSTDLAVQRRRYREFAAVPAFASLVRTIPLYSTWDDHDFGKNDTDGLLKGKQHARQAFIEYHPGSVEYGEGGNGEGGNGEGGNGEGGQGVYSSFRNGPVEVFLLDTRWFAGTEKSPVDPAKTTLLGKQQWEWLTPRLKASTAPFKLLTSGMIWNDAVRPGKTDYWGHYPNEREALFRFIGDNHISGCVLVSGDIHRSRVIRHATAQTAGYPLTELITSPMHDSLIALANAPHPGLVKDMGEVHSFLLLTADSTVTPPTLDALFTNNDGKELFRMPLVADELRHVSPPRTAPAEPATAPKP